MKSYHIENGTMKMYENGQRADVTDSFFGSENPNNLNSVNDARCALKEWVEAGWITSEDRVTFNGIVIQEEIEFQVQMTIAGSPAKLIPLYCYTKREFAELIWDFYIDKDEYNSVETRLYRADDLQCNLDDAGNEIYLENGEPDYAVSGEPIIDLDDPQDFYCIENYKYEMVECQDDDEIEDGE